MINNLYIIAIGGTGVRVLKSFTMLLATGVKINANEVTPIIIDTDADNGNLKDLLATLENYMAMRKAIWKDKDMINGIKEPFFGTKMGNPIKIINDGSEIGTLESKDNLYTNGLDAEEMNIIKLLFDDNDLKMNLKYGFIGQPNIGTIALNHIFEKNKLLEKVGKDEGDAVFFINSVFGGTGAAGFPLLLKKFKELETTMPIGASVLLPYFKLIEQETEEDDLKNYSKNINDRLFDAKTLISLSHYDNEKLPDNLQKIYYIGDYLKSSYVKSLGGKNQMNPANVIEIIAASSIFNFAETANITDEKKFLQYYIEENVKSVKLKHFEAYLQRPMIKFQAFRLYYNFFLKQTIEKGYWNKKYGITKDDYNPTYDGKSLTEFFERYDEWCLQAKTGKLEEQRNNEKFNSITTEREFAPFELEPQNLEAFELQNQFNLDNNSWVQKISETNKRKIGGFLLNSSYLLDDIFIKTNKSFVKVDANKSFKNNKNKHEQFMTIVSTGFEKWFELFFKTTK